MSADFTYAGAVLLNKAVAETSDRELLGNLQILPLVDTLNAACSAGLSLEQTRDATTLFFLLLQKVLDDAQKIARLDRQWLERVVQEIETHWYERVPLLTADIQYGVYDLIDRIYRAWMFKHEPARQRAVKLLDELPIPAVHVAAALLTLTLEPGKVTATHLRCADLIDRYADDLDQLLQTAWLKSRLWFQYAQVCTRFSGNDLRYLHELWEFHGYLTKLFGADMSAYKIGLFGGGQKKLEAVQQRTALVTKMTELSYGTPSDPWIRKFYQYLHARIEAATNDVKGARKEFKKLREGGFAIYDTALYLGFIHNFLKDPDDARRVVEELALAVPLVQGSVLAAEMITEVYAEAGGKPTQLGHPRPPEAVQAQAAQNELVRRQNFTPQLAVAGGKAVAEFWARRESIWQRYVARTFRGEHFNAALGEDDSGLLMQLDASVAAVCSIDELPALARLDRSLLIEATKRPVAAERVAGEVLKYCDHLGAHGRSFADLCQSFPGLAHSWAVCWRQLRPLCEANKVPEITRILEQLERFPAMSDATLARIFDKVSATLLAQPSWMDAMQRGQRLLKRFGDAAARETVVRVLRDHGFFRLSQGAVSAVWPAVTEVLLAVDPDPATGQKLVMWLGQQFDGATHTQASLPVGELLAARLPPALATTARDLSAAVLLKELATADFQSARALSERLLRLCSADTACMEQLVVWFTGRCSAERVSGGAIELGEWLTGQLTDARCRERVCAATRDLLLSELSEQTALNSAQRSLDRLMRLAANDPKVHAAIDRWYENWKPAAAVRAELGEWLLAHAPALPADSIRAITRQALENLVTAAPDQSERMHQLERLTALYPSDVELERRLKSVRRERALRRAKIAGIIAVVWLVLVLIVRFMLRRP